MYVYTHTHTHIESYRDTIMHILPSPHMNTPHARAHMNIPQLWFYHKYDTNNREWTKAHIKILILTLYSVPVKCRKKLFNTQDFASLLCVLCWWFFFVCFFLSLPNFPINSIMEILSQRQLCLDKWMQCHTVNVIHTSDIYLILSQYTATRPNSPSTDPIGAWHCRHKSTNF